jgi:hypothetical protein
VITEAHALVLQAREYLPQCLLALAQRNPTEVEPVEEGCVEREVHATHVPPGLHRVLQSLKVAHAVVPEHDHLAVEPRARDGQAAERARERRKPRGPIVAAT